MDLKSTTLLSNQPTFKISHLKDHDIQNSPDVPYCGQIFEYLVEKFRIWLNLVESGSYSG